MALRWPADNIFPDIHSAKLQFPRRIHMIEVMQLAETCLYRV